MLEGIGRLTRSRHGFCVVCLCQGKAEEQNFFSFVAIEPANYRYFKKNYKPGTALDFSVYGYELLRGEGISPTPEIIRFVSTRYNIEFGTDRRFVDRLVALATHVPPVSADESPFPLKPAEALGS